MNSLHARVAAASAACLFLVACGTVPPPDPRPAQLARIPASTEFVAQVDVQRVFTAADVSRWLELAAGLEEPLGDTACLLDSLGRAGYATVAAFGTEPGRAEEEGALVSGGLGARELADCIVTVYGAAAEMSPPDISADGHRASVGPGHDRAVLADLPDGSGIVIGSEAGVDALLAGREGQPSFADHPLLARLREATGGGDAEAFVVPAVDPASIGLPLRAAALGLRRGATDRYTVVAVADSPAGAAMLSLGVAAAITKVREFAALAAAESDLGGGEGEALRAVLPPILAVADALSSADVQDEGDVVRVAFELDPAVVSPTALLVATGALLWTSRSEEAGPPGEDQAPSDSFVGPAGEGPATSESFVDPQ